MRQMAVLLFIVIVTAVLVFLYIETARRDHRRARAHGVHVQGVAKARASRAGPLRTSSPSDREATLPARSVEALPAQPDHAPKGPGVDRLLAVTDSGLGVADEYVALRTVLGESGRSSESWTVDAVAVFDEILSDLVSAGTVQRSPTECFRAGCIVDLSYPLNGGVLDGASATSALILDRLLMHHWRGEKMQTGLRHERSETMNSLVLVRPETLSNQEVRR